MIIPIVTVVLPALPSSSPQLITELFSFYPSYNALNQNPGIPTVVGDHEAVSWVPELCSCQGTALLLSLSLSLKGSYTPSALQYFKIAMPSSELGPLAPSGDWYPMDQKSCLFLCTLYFQGFGRSRDKLLSSTLLLSFLHCSEVKAEPFNAAGTIPIQHIELVKAAVSFHLSQPQNLDLSESNLKHRHDLSALENKPFPFHALTPGLHAMTQPQTRLRNAVCMYTRLGLKSVFAHNTGEVCWWFRLEIMLHIRYWEVEWILGFPLC